jgi:thiamine-phosphate pyrophosphorylase
MNKINDRSLYLIISGEYANGRTALEVAKSAIAGGVDIIQMREKGKPRENLVRTGRELAGLCRENGVIFIVNDDPLLAKEVGADGVHLGAEDIKRFPLVKTRSILGPGKIIGVSTGSLAEFETANASGADYIGYGPVFPTKIKDGCSGTADIPKIMAGAGKPVFFLGGIDMSNVGEVLEMGGKNISVIRAICEADDITAATKKLKRRINEARTGKTARTR